MSFNIFLFYIYLLCMIDIANSQRPSLPQNSTLGVPSEVDSNLGGTGGFLTNNVPSGSEEFSDVGDMNREPQNQVKSGAHVQNRAVIDSTIARNTGFPRFDTRGPQVPFGSVRRKPPQIRRDRRNKSQNPQGVSTIQNEINLLPFDSTANIIKKIGTLAMDIFEQNQNLVSKMPSVDTSDQAGQAIASVSVQGFTPVASGPNTLPYNMGQSESNTRRFQGPLQPESSHTHDGGIKANIFPTDILDIQNNTKLDLFGDSQFVTTVANPRNTPQSDTQWLWQSLEISDEITSGSQNPNANFSLDRGSGKRKSSGNTTRLDIPSQQPGFMQDIMNGFNTQQTGTFNRNNISTTSSHNKRRGSSSFSSSRGSWNGIKTLPTVSPFSFLTTKNGKIDMSSGRSAETIGIRALSSSRSSSTGDSLETISITPSLKSSTITSQQETIPCSEEYQDLRGHTLCMNDDPRVVVTGISAANKMAILNLHNELRANVQPPAADLVALKWNERLAIIAAKWAKQCTLGHDTERRVPEIGIHIGQNVAVGYTTWEEVVRMWYNEIRIWQYGIDPDNYLGTGRWRDVAHFTQIVQNATYLVGCGYAECRNTPYIRFYVCNYAAGQSDLAYPYTTGSRCGACPKNCNNGLCDCGNKVCYNKGTLDLDSCTCKCRKPHAGSMCELLDCPVEDQWICGRDWPAEHCNIYYNVPEVCPHMCGLCKGGIGVGGKSRQPVKPNTTFVSGYGCRYSGIRANPEECMEYGEYGADMNMCASEGGTIGCGDCDRFFNVKRDYCPVMCGLCDAPCDGKKCINRGTLDVISCNCTCRPPFTGSTCEQVDCPPTGDPLYCRLWPRHYCGLYYNVPEECPYMCDLCSRMTTRTALLSTH